MLKSKRAAIAEMEKALQLAVKIPCDCKRPVGKPGYCLGDCDGSRIWTAIYNARKFFKCAKLQQPKATILRPR